MTHFLRISVPVRAIPGGNSKRAFVSPKTGRAFVVDKTKGKDQFIATVRQFAAAAASDTEWKIADGAVIIAFKFVFARPKHHYGTGRNSGLIKFSQSFSRPTGKPDLTNIVKRVEDALAGIVWKDDSQVVETSAIKMWGETDSVEIVVEARGAESILETRIGPNFAQDESEAAKRPNYQPTPRKTRQRKARAASGEPRVEPMAGQAAFGECDE